MKTVIGEEKQTQKILAVPPTAEVGLAPTKQLLNDWKKQRISWDEYTVRYRREMLAHKTTIAELAEKSKVRTITLLCL